MAKKYPTLNVFKSVSTPTAQSNTLCAVDRELLTSSPSGEIFSLLSKKCGVAIAICYLLQKKYALRISEVLSFKYYNVTSTGLVVFRGSKGSNDKLVDIDCLKDFFIKCRLHCVNPFSHLNRYIVYRAYVKYGLNEYYSYGSKNAVTHSFRYAKVAETQEIEKDMELSRLVIGHKSISNTKKYAEKRK
jgi:hypothetical protein